MTYAILSDIHANLEALTAVLADARQHAETLICLGDIVGYNANPRECLQLVQQHCAVVIAGNHDLAAAGVRPYHDFNRYARQAIDWTRARLTPAEVLYLRQLPRIARFGRACLAAHGSPRDTDEYLLTRLQFVQSFAYLQQHAPEVRYCFVGHTHLPTIWRCTAAGEVEPETVTSPRLALDPACRYLINPGSVGQPRYGEPLSTYVLFDEEALQVEFRFVAYDIETAQDKIYAAGLPPYLAERLAIGQ
ncbi:MAG: metallophosphoesterase [Candidatus Tectimicrobiota bacterium]|nr:MAG: metallophosphoesterase [Candidatus Tectomicrobia bacterium]